MPKVQKITDHPTKVRGTETNRSTNWKCRQCGKVYEVNYEDFKTLRAHLRAKHPIEYKPYTIDEEPEHVGFDHMSLLRT